MFASVCVAWHFPGIDWNLKGENLQWELWKELKMREAGHNVKEGAIEDQVG